MAVTQTFVINAFVFTCLFLKCARSLTCPEGKYLVPEKGCFPCDLLCDRNRDECRLYCPGYYLLQRPNPGNIMVNPQEPAVIPSGKELSETDGQPTGKVAESAENQSENNSPLNVLGIVGGIIGFVAVVVVVVFTVKKFQERKRVTTARDIEMQEMGCQGEEGQGANTDGEDEGREEVVVNVVESEDENLHDMSTESDRNEELLNTPLLGRVEAARVQDVPNDRCIVHTEDSIEPGPSQPESQIGHVEHSTTESEIPVSSIDNSLRPSGTLVPRLPDTLVVTAPKHAVNLGIYPIQYEPSTATGPTPIAQEETDPTQTAAKVPVGLNQSRDEAEEEVTDEESETERTPAEGHSSHETLPFSIQATTSNPEINETEAVQALDDNHSDTPVGAVGGGDLSIEATDIDSDNYVIHEPQSLQPYLDRRRGRQNTAHHHRSLPNGVQRYNHPDVGRMFGQRTPENSETSEEDSSDGERS